MEWEDNHSTKKKKKAKCLLDLEEEQALGITITMKNIIL
jgi:hypothetical protein